MAQAWKCGLVPTCFLLAWGCRGGGGAVSTYPAAPLILISIDTLRSDRLAAYGYKAGSTPTLDGLAREGIVFEDVFSQCPLTLPAHASLFTGLLPPHHGVRDNMGFALRGTHRTLASRLGAAGWTTGAAVSAYVLRSGTGIAQGFSSYDEVLDVGDSPDLVGAAQRDGLSSVEALVRWIETQGGPRPFAFLHLYEPHAPYTPPPAHASHPDAYDGEVAYADELVGRFFGRLKSLGLYDRALIAVTSDHGEGLRDHGEQEHGLLLYRESIQVPFILKLPGGAKAGTRLRGSVSQVDIAPTLLDLLGVSADGMDGVSLRSALAAGVVRPGPVYSETYYPRYHFGWSEILSVTEDRFHYLQKPRPEFFDLSRDPGERTNLFESRASTAAHMGQWIRTGVGGDATSTPEPVSPEVRERLAALGYVGSGSPALGPLSDPRDKVVAYEEFKQGLALRDAGRLDEAVVLLEKVLAAEPGMNDAWQVLGSVWMRLRRAERATAAFEKMLSTDSSNLEANLALATLRALAGNTDRALVHAEVAAAHDPARGFETLALLLLDKGRPVDAANAARRSLSADSRRVMSHFALGVAQAQTGQCQEALAAFRQAEELRARRKNLVIRALHAGMGDCLAKLGQAAEAEQEYLTELSLVPDSREGRLGLAALYRAQGRSAEARQAPKTTRR